MWNGICESVIFRIQEEEDRLIEDKALRDTENTKEMENPLAVLKGILSEVWYVKSLLLWFFFFILGNLEEGAGVCKSGQV